MTRAAGLEDSCGGIRSGRENSRKVDLDRFKQNNIWGVDQDTPVVTLSIVNMIFRGDGKNILLRGGEK